MTSPTVVARGGHGATTVAATSQLAALAGIEVFATGGIGGVHREARETWDESADLQALATTPIVVVCAGVKSILDVAATLERLESLGVGVLGFGTDTFPGFYLTDSGHPLDWRVDSPDEVAAVMRARTSLGTDDRGLVVANPLPVDEQVDPELHDRVLRAGLTAAAQAGVRGKEVTPFLLEFFHRESGGASLTANIRIILRNAALAAQIAVAAVAAMTPLGAQTLSVVVVGDLMVDVIALMSGPLAVASDTPSRVSTSGGGSAANVAAWLASQDVPTTFVGRVGDDPLGHQACTELYTAGVDVRAVLSDRPTGSCVVLVEPDGQRSMLPDTGANATLDASDLPEEVFRPSAHLHLSGYPLLHPESRDAAFAAMGMAREIGMTISVDPSSVALLEGVGPGNFLDWTVGVDLLLANADEARVLSGQNPSREAAAALATVYREVVVKLGDQGALWHGGFIAASAPAERGVEVLDTTGAGDAFAAGFLTSWLLHPEPESALAAGNSLAAGAVSKLGGRP